MPGRTYLAVNPPQITWDGTALLDPRSFAIVRQIRSQFVGGRPGDAWDTTVEVNREGYEFAIVIGDEESASSLLALPRSGLTDRTLICTTVGSHDEENIVYTLLNATITSFAPIGSGYQEARTFAFTGVARSADGVTDPLAVA
ncbi:MAG: hypothetical protein ACOC0P_01305 [Planctomycetota bacterium]